MRPPTRRRARCSFRGVTCFVSARGSVGGNACLFVCVFVVVFVWRTEYTYTLRFARNNFFLLSFGYCGAGESCTGDELFRRCRREAVGYTFSAASLSGLSAVSSFLAREIRFTKERERPLGNCGLCFSVFYYARVARVRLCVYVCVCSFASVQRSLKVHLKCFSTLNAGITHDN